MPWADRADAEALHEAIRSFLEIVLVERTDDLRIEAEKCGQTSASLASRLLLDLLDERGLIAHPDPKRRTIVETPEGFMDLTLPPIPANLVDAVKVLTRLAGDATSCLWATYGEVVRSLPENDPQRQKLETSQLVIQRWRDHLGLDVEDLLASVEI